MDNTGNIQKFDWSLLSKSTSGVCVIMLIYRYCNAVHKPLRTNLGDKVCVSDGANGTNCRTGCRVNADTENKNLFDGVYFRRIFGR